MSRRRKWLARLALAAILLLALVEGFSWQLREGRLRHYLHERLEARLAVAFGRPVEVGFFEVSLLRGPRLEAGYVTIGENPRFGGEYFLRAERLAAQLRWSALLRGRLELGTLTLRRASLNLVRAADGQWNLETWLPPRRAGGAAPAPEAARLTRVEFDACRVNFKRGLDKHPFAFTAVRGSVASEADGRWRLELEARPHRAGLVLQQGGVIRVRGRVSGTSLRLQPAELAADWTGVSLSDALRLARGYDYGVRGDFSAAVRASSDAGIWRFAASGRVSGAHRWDLPGRATDPGVRLAAEAEWAPHLARLDLRSLRLEAPGTVVTGAGHLAWTLPERSEIRLASEQLAAADLFAWYRAFTEGVSEAVAVEGAGALALELGGWPPAVERGTLTGENLRLRAPGVTAAFTTARAELRFHRDRIELLPAAIHSEGGAALTLSGALHRGEPWRFAASLAGEAPRSEDLLAASAALGWPRVPGWQISGGAAGRLEWRGTLAPFSAERSGSLDLRGLRVRAEPLAVPVTLARARVEFRGPAARRRGAAGLRVALAAAEAFGARWSGTLERAAGDERWDVALEADRLDLAGAAGWFVSRERPGLIARVLPGLRREPASRERGRPEGAELRVAGGRLRVGRLELPGQALEQLDAQIMLSGGDAWQLRATDARAALAGGRVTGTLDAAFGVEPSYRIEAALTDVNLAALAGSSPALGPLVAGRASGEFFLSARGAGREALVASLEGAGRAELRDADFRGLDLRASFAAGARRPGVTHFDAGTARFRIASGRVEFEDLNLSAGRLRFEAEGAAGFSRALDLRVRLASPAMLAQNPAGVVPADAAAESRVLHLTGRVEALDVAAVAPAPPRARR